MAEEIEQPEQTQPDEAFKQAALVDAEKRQRERQCWNEINSKLSEIANRYHCTLQIVETRVNGQTVEIGFRPVAQNLVGNE